MKRPSKLSRPLNREELAWAAGFFDGEGTSHCRLPTSKTHRQLVVQLEQYYDNEAVEKLWEAFGLLGTVYYRPRNNKPRYIWEVTGFEKVQFVMAAMWPWLCSPKKEQYISALETYKLSQRIA